MKRSGIGGAVTASVLMMALLLASAGSAAAQDSDGDGIEDAADNCPYVYNPDQAYTEDLPGMLSYWKFDEGSGATAGDSAGSLPGTLVGGAGWTAGQVGGALNLTGGYVRAPNSAIFSSLSQISIDAWIKTTANATQSIVHKGDTYYEPFFLRLVGTQLRGYVRTGSPKAVSGGNIQINHWHHVAMSYDGSAIRIYIDGSEVGSVEQAGNVYRDGEDLFVGRSGGGWPIYHGLIDELAIYGRALRADEIVRHYRNGLGAHGYFGDGLGDACDNCPAVYNLDQADTDGEEIGDACDNCPAVINPDQADADGSGMGDACNDPYDLDQDEWEDGIDNCSQVFNPDQADTDGSGVGDACNSAGDPDDDEWEDGYDNCPSTHNPDQADGNEDGDGDACQPTVEILAITNGGLRGALRAEAELSDPNGDPLSGTVAITSAGGEPVTIMSDHSGSVDGLSFCYAMGSYLMSPDWGYCYDGGWERTYFAATSYEAQDCDTWEANGKSLLRDYVSIYELSYWAGPLPITLCVIDGNDLDRFADLTIMDWSYGPLTYSGGSEIILEEPYADGLPASLPLDALAGREGEELKLAITATDGETAPVADAESFIYQGENSLVFPGDEEALPPGREEPSAGFGQGEKAGWEGGLPPGFDKGKKTGWEK
ncbi:MAG: LamG-like jellyroll fold domain-containing protein [Elusimicrobiota bacterium]